MLERQTLTPDEEWDRYWPQAFEVVRSGRVRWNAGLNKQGGFEWSGGARIDDGDSCDGQRMLITLWKARANGLIRVDGAAVLLTGWSPS